MTLTKEEVKRRYKLLVAQQRAIEAEYSRELEGVRQGFRELEALCPHEWGEWQCAQYERSYRICDLCGAEDS